MNIKLAARVILKLTIEKLIPTFICPSYIVKSVCPPPRSYFMQRRAFNKSVYYIHNSQDLGEYVVYEGKYWVEEHRTPCEGKSSNTSLSSSEIIALKHATIDGKRLYDKSNSKYAGNVHYDLRIDLNNKITSFVISELPTHEKKQITAILQPQHYKKDPPVIMKGYGKGVKVDSINGACIGYIANEHLHVQLEGTYKFGYAYIPIGAVSDNVYLMQPLNPKPIHNSPKTKMKFLLFGRDDALIEALIKNPSYVCSAKKDGTRVNISHIHDKSGYTYINIGSHKGDKNAWKMYYKKLGVKLEDAPRIQYNTKLGIFRVWDPLNKLGGIDISAEAWTPANTGTNPSVTKRVAGSDFTSRKCKAVVSLYPHTVCNTSMTPAQRWGFLMGLREFTKGLYKQLPHAKSERAKRRLIKKCKGERAVDGVVFYNTITGAICKVKWVEDSRDGIIVSSQRIVDKNGEYKNMAIPIVKVNSKVSMPMSGALTNTTKTDLFFHPEDYVGATAKYRCTSITKNGIPFQPILESIEV